MRTKISDLRSKRSFLTRWLLRARTTAAIIALGSSTISAAPSDPGVDEPYFSSRDYIEARYFETGISEASDSASAEQQIFKASIGCDSISFDGASRRRDNRYRTPAMMGDFFGGARTSLRGNSVFDRLLILADDLDTPAIAPPAGSFLNLSEPGPIGVFDTSLNSVQQLQAILRAAAPVPGGALVGTIPSNASLITQQTFADIQNQLTGTPLGFDIIQLQPPPGIYLTAVDAIFETRNGPVGITSYDAASSGAILQGGADSLLGGQDLDAYYFFDYAIRFNANVADATSGGVGRLKIAEGGAVMPTDRIFLRYNYVNDVGYDNRSAGLNRFVAGFEKTFAGGLYSLELRAPLATDSISSSTLEGNQFTSSSNARFGNLTMYAKALLINRRQFVLSGGLGLALPTAQDSQVNYNDGSPLLRIENQSVHIQPFLGMLYTPTSRIFAQAFVQYDAVASGNNVMLDPTGAGLSGIGTLTDANHIFLDAAIGYWAFRSDSNRGLTGVIPMLELHQNSALQEGDMITSGPFQIGNFDGRTSFTNLTIGTTLEFARRSQFTVGYSAPIGGGRDQMVDGAMQVYLNRNF